VTTTSAASASSPRVVVLTPYFRPIVGGVESNAERLALFLRAGGFGVTVLTKRLTADLPDADATDHVRIERIGPLGARSPSGKWQMLPAVTAWLVRHRTAYDVVCSIDCRGVGLGALAARGVSGRPVIVQPQTTGVLMPDGTSGPLAAPVKGALGSLYAHADAVACIAHTIEREALARGIPRERVHFLPNAIDMRRFSMPTAAQRAAAREMVGVKPDEVACVFLGRLSREKGLMDLLHAWVRLRPRNAGVLLVAGPDMDGHAWNVGPEARAFVESQGLDRSVRFLGPVTDVARLMHAADVLIQPSHFEALGLSAVEALACGVPVIASAVGGLVDFVVDGVNGRTCPPKDPAALAEQLQTLIDDGDLRRRLASAARPSVEREYDEQLVFNRFADLIRELAARQPVR
jgi:glycosyltransferase involved in cell wall biosynthesis